ncbi:MAG: zinc-binding dehydrogenase, partial [Thermoplasmata archaeon]|nr:zinc-binding dehydrogenase [Thermoplasmata archaeon]
MIGLGFEDHGGLDRLRLVRVPTPQPAPGEVRLRLKAAGFNRLDRFVLEGIPGVPVERPHILGSDGAGVVDELGEGVTDLEIGAKVLLNPGLWDGTCEACRAGQECLCRNYRIVGEHTQGTATEFVVVPRRNVHPLPSRLSFEEGAAAPLVFQTAWRALMTTGALAPGETVAIVGAGGGVATAAIQIAKLRGARVLVATRSPEKAERCRALGADEVIAITSENPLDRALWAWSEKKGVDVIFDSVGAPTVGRSLRALARGGRLIIIGATGGPQVEIDVRPLFWRQSSIRGSTMSTRAEFAAVLHELDEGRLKPVIDRIFGPGDAVEAFHRFDAPDLFGKIVLQTPPTG